MDQYPKAKYNASAQQKVVGSLEEEQALGEGWGDLDIISSTINVKCAMHGR